MYLQLDSFDLRRYTGSNFVIILIASMLSKAVPRWVAQTVPAVETCSSSVVM